MSSTTSPDAASRVPCGAAARRAYFDALYAASADPWRLGARWYEARKRALTLACLPRERYQLAYEPGCAAGELSALLAARCDRLLISDGSAAAVELARLRVQALPHVEARCAWLPDGWPDGRYDLIVLSEFVYYLHADAIDRLMDAARRTLLGGGTLIACHYRHTIAGCDFDGDEVHGRIAARLALPIMTTLVERDFRIDVWCSDPPSVSCAQQTAA